MNLRVLSIFLGVFFLFEGISKLGWLTDASVLTSRLQEWLGTASSINRWYLETVAIPGAPVFARLVMFGELAVGTALIAGFRARLTATIALLMVLNFHFASGVMFQYSYLTNGYGLPVLGGLLALALGPNRLPFSLLR
jgi:uncharacterized membrane protein YphA (DoxX/SURF4 family)